MKVVVITFLCFTAVLAKDAFYENPHNTDMATMPKSELMEILDCLAESKDRGLCRWYSGCLGLLPKGVMMAFMKCRRTITGVEWIPCEHPGPLWPYPGAGGDVFDCISGTLGNQETPEEKAAMYQYETCARKVYATGCRHRRVHYGLY